MNVSRVIIAISLVLAGASMAWPQQRRPVPIRIDPLTSSISGRVTSNTGGPLRRAEVRAVSESGLTRLATTDSDGRYLVRDLPAGTFTLHVSKTGFVPLYFGQRRPFERRTTIRLEQGQRVAADVSLPRAGAIAGRVYDTTGEPILGARVQALRRRAVQGQPGLQAVGVADTTDDTGAYRLYGLPPGEYYVIATPRRVEDRAGRPLGTVPGRGAPIFFPGTANRDLAQRVTVDVTGEARADMQLTEVITARVTGTVLTSAGAPASGAMVTLVARDLDFATSGVGDSLGPLRIMDDAAADGTFELTGVPPGSFVLVAQTRPNISAAFDIPNQRLIGGQLARPVLETASMPVTVDGDVAGLTLSTAAGGTVAVNIVADQGVTAPLPAARISVRSADRGMSESMTMMHNGPAVSAKMAMALTGPTYVSVEGLPDNWAIKAIMLDNTDVTDRAIDLAKDQGTTIRVVLTDRVTELAGSVTSGSFAPTDAETDATVVIFPDDESKWSYPSRFVRSVRADADGTFQVTGLPPSLDYRAVAVDYLEDGEETDPEFLKRMRDRAARFSLREGERRAIDLRLIQR
jgi:hypothetical protein